MWNCIDALFQRRKGNCYILWFDAVLSTASSQSVILRCVLNKKRLLFISCRMLFQDPIAVNKGQQVSGKLEFVVNEKFSYHITMTAGIDGTAVKTSNKINLHDQVIDQNIICFIAHNVVVHSLRFHSPHRTRQTSDTLLSLDFICLRSSMYLSIAPAAVNLSLPFPSYYVPLLQQMYHYLNPSAASISYPPTAASRQCNPDTDY